MIPTAIGVAVAVILIAHARHAMRRGEKMRTIVLGACAIVAVAIGLRLDADLVDAIVRTLSGARYRY